MGDIERLTTLGEQLRAVHDRLRKALALTREAVEGGAPVPDPTRDLALHCVGFCAALDGHHRSEDTHLFALVEQHRPDLTPAVEMLRQDHRMIASLLLELRQVMDSGAEPATTLRHLEGIDAIMESHFRYEERQLTALLDTRSTGSGDPRRLFGDIA
jgi:hypothetical protein